MVVPTIIKVFLAFSAAVSLLELTIFIPGLIWLKETTVPFTGWGGNIPFFFAIGTWPGLFKGAGYSIDANALRGYLTRACLTMAIGVGWGVVDFWMFGALQTDSSPWIRYQPLRPLWTIALPLAWAVLLWNERARIKPQPVEPSPDVRNRFASSFQTKSSFFFMIFGCALIVWLSEARYYWVYSLKMTYAKGLLIVVAIVGIASLLAGVFFRLAEDRSGPT
jgi:hypothetical protein